MDKEDITERFDTIDVNGAGAYAMSEVRDLFKQIALQLDPLSAGRARAVALTELESAHRAVNRAIAESNKA